MVELSVTSFSVGGSSLTRFPMSRPLSCHIGIVTYREGVDLSEVTFLILHIRKSESEVESTGACELTKKQPRCRSGTCSVLIALERERERERKGVNGNGGRAKRFTLPTRLT